MSEMKGRFLEEVIGLRYLSLECPGASSVIALELSGSGQARVIPRERGPCLPTAPSAPTAWTLRHAASWRDARRQANRDGANTLGIYWGGTWPVGRASIRERKRPWPNITTPCSNDYGKNEAKTKIESGTTSPPVDLPRSTSLGL